MDKQIELERLLGWMLSLEAVEAADLHERLGNEGFVISLDLVHRVFVEAKARAVELVLKPEFRSLMLLLQESAVAHPEAELLRELRPDLLQEIEGIEELRRELRRGE